ncbi:Gfo/Idh/MocA family oxidoreductase [bacterium]|nr:Gfo/Idh/MocA family oxidoreductase [bacterium]
MKRRDFIKRTAAVGAILGSPTVIPSEALGKDGSVAANDKAAIGLIACGNRAGYAGMYKRYPKSEVVAVSDPIRERRLRFKKTFNNCADYNDFRELLARSDVDAVHIATADHWHVPIALHAARAGKDMYTEKPLGISIEQDLKAREIVDTHKRVFQYGAQQRSQTHVRLGIELVLNGHIGEVKECYVWAPHGESGGSPTPVLPVPDGFDYDLWLGPASKAPFCEDRAQGRAARNGIFHIYDYAIGFIAGWGAHPMDMLQWWADNAGMAEIPVKYEGKGTIPTKGLFNTVTRWDVRTEYANGITMRFMDDQTARAKKPHPSVQSGHGTAFVGTEGWVTVGRWGWKTSSEALRKKAKDAGKKKLKVSRGQIENFVDCVLSREEPVDNLHSAVRSDVATHLAEISIRTGKAVEWDPKLERIKDAETRKLMHREMRKPWKI